MVCVTCQYPGLWVSKPDTSLQVSKPNSLQMSKPDTSLQVSKSDTLLQPPGVKTRHLTPGIKTGHLAVEVVTSVQSYSHFIHDYKSLHHQYTSLIHICNFNVLLVHIRVCLQICKCADPSFPCRPIVPCLLTCPPMSNKSPTRCEESTKSVLSVLVPFSYLPHGYTLFPISVPEVPSLCYFQCSTSIFPLFLGLLFVLKSPEYI